MNIGQAQTFGFKPSSCSAEVPQRTAAFGSDPRWRWPSQKGKACHRLICVCVCVYGVTWNFEPWRDLLSESSCKDAQKCCACVTDIEVPAGPSSQGERIAGSPFEGPLCVPKSHFNKQATQSRFQRWHAVCTRVQALLPAHVFMPTLM